MAKYTLFVDESGKFSRSEGPREQRLVGGVLVPGDGTDGLDDLKEELDRIAKAAVETEWFQSLRAAAQGRKVADKDLRKLLEGEVSWKHLHYSPLLSPKFSQDQWYEPNDRVSHQAGVNEVARETLAAVLRVHPDAVFVTAENLVPPGTSNLALYRSMLADVVGEVTRHVPKEFNRLAVVISQSSLYEDLAGREAEERAKGAEEVGNWEFSRHAESDRQLAILTERFEAGLAARGLLTAARKVDYFIEPARTGAHPLLVASDLVCGLARNRFNRRYAPAAREVIQELNADAERFFVIEAFGNADERRARVMEREGDFCGAALLWSGLTVAGKPHQENVDRVVAKLCEAKHAMSARFALEELIERCEKLRGERAPERFYRQLRSLEQAYGPSCDHCPELLFRLRSYMFIQANHLGEWTECDRLHRQLEQRLPDVRSNPSDLPSVLRFQIAQIEHAVNDIRLEDAAERAREHWRSVEEYEDRLAGRIGELEGVEKPREATRSPAALRAQWSLWRSHTLGSRAESKALSDVLDSSLPYWEQGIADPAGSRISQDDLSRLHAIRCVARVRLLNYAAIEVALKETSALVRSKHPAASGPYVLASTLRLCADALLFVSNLDAIAQSEFRARVMEIVNEGALKSAYVAFAGRDAKIDRHPWEVIARDFALLNGLTGSPAEEAQPILTLAEDYLARKLTSAPIFSWLYSLHRTTQAYLEGEPIPNDGTEYLRSHAAAAPNVLRIRKTLAEALSLDHENLDGSEAHRLLRLRLVSPY